MTIHLTLVNFFIGLGVCTAVAIVLGVFYAIFVFWAFGRGMRGK